MGYFPIIKWFRDSILLYTSKDQESAKIYIAES